MEKVTSHPSIWSSSMKMARNMLSKHSQKKALTVKTKVNNHLSTKLKSCEILIIKILWNFTKSTNHKIQFMSVYNCYKVANFMTKSKININFLYRKLRLSWKVSFKDLKLCMPRISCTEISNHKIFSSEKKEIMTVLLLILAFQQKLMWVNIFL